MAISNGYSTLQQAKDYMWRDTQAADATDDSVVEDLVEKASRVIDRFTGRTFYARTETRQYDTPSTWELWLDDDLLAVTTLTNGDGNTLTAGADYVLRPYNVTPTYAIELVPGSGVWWQLSSTTNSPQQAISVEGTWGFSTTTPEDVELACLILVKDAYNKRYAGDAEQSGLVTPDGVRVLPMGLPLRARALLEPFKRMT